MGPAMTQALGQAWVVENRVGANGIIGMEAVIHSNPDGYTLSITQGAPADGIRFLETLQQSRGQGGMRIGQGLAHDHHVRDGGETGPVGIIRDRAPHTLEDAANT